MTGTSELCILVDCRSVTPGTSGGIENFVYSLVRALAEVGPSDQIRINVPAGTSDAFRQALRGPSNVEFVEDPWLVRWSRFRSRVPWLRYPIGAASRLSRTLSRRLLGPRRGWVQSLDQWADVVLCPFQRDEIGFEQTPCVMVMHDFRDFDMPEDDGQLAAIESANVQRAAVVATSWPYPYQRLCELFPDRSDSSAMVPFVVDQPSLDEPAVDVDDSLLVYVSSTAEHKNHEVLVQALGVLRRRGARPIRVLCPGPTSVVRQRKLQALARAVGVEDSFTVLGFVERETIHTLYRTAVGVITTSRYEALSGALLEGLQFGKPVACSRIPPNQAFVDLVGARVWYFDPTDPENVAQAILTMLDEAPGHRPAAKETQRRLAVVTPRLTAERYRDLLTWAAGRSVQPGWLPYGALCTPNERVSASTRGLD